LRFYPAKFAASLPIKPPQDTTKPNSFCPLKIEKILKKSRVSAASFSVLSWQNLASEIFGAFFANRGTTRNKRSHEDKMKKSLPVFFFAILFSQNAWAATFTVTTSADLVDDKPGDGICKTALTIPHCTLRAAIMEANALSGSDTIELDGLSTYKLGLADTSSTDEDSAKTGDLDVTDSVTINGNDAIIEGPVAGTYSRGIFDVLLGKKFKLSHVTITKARNTAINVHSFTSGSTATSSALIEIRDSKFISNTGSDAGAIASHSNLSVVNCEFTDNASVSGGSAGAISAFADATIRSSTFEKNTGVNGGAVNVSGDLQLTKSQFDGNMAWGDGGALALFDSASASIEKSTFANNISGGTGEGNGGAIALNNENFVSIQNSSFTSNKTYGTYGGGGVYCSSKPSSLEIISSTFTKNSAEKGSAIYNRCATTLTNSTLSENESTKKSGGAINANADTEINSSTINKNENGGLSFRSKDTVATLRNTILVGDEKASECSHTYTSSKIDSQGYNLIGNADACQFLTKKPTDLKGTAGAVLNPELNVLEDRGGATKTHSLKASSPAVDAGNPAGCSDGSKKLTFDQRGNGYFRHVGAACDIGAYEIPGKGYTSK
jgi:CSLREA domain-containing protein